MYDENGIISRIRIIPAIFNDLFPRIGTNYRWIQSYLVNSGIHCVFILNQIVGANV